jgi:hypothetical protein
MRCRRIDLKLMVRGERQKTKTNAGILHYVQDDGCYWYCRMDDGGYWYGSSGEVP